MERVTDLGAPLAPFHATRMCCATIFAGRPALAVEVGAGVEAEADVEVEVEFEDEDEVEVQVEVEVEVDAEVVGLPLGAVLS